MAKKKLPTISSLEKHVKTGLTKHSALNKLEGVEKVKVPKQKKTRKAKAKRTY